MRTGHRMHRTPVGGWFHDWHGPLAAATGDSTVTGGHEARKAPRAVRGPPSAPTLRMPDHALRTRGLMGFLEPEPPGRAEPAHRLRPAYRWAVGQAMAANPGVLSAPRLRARSHIAPTAPDSR